MKNKTIKLGDVLSLLLTEEKEKEQAEKKASEPVEDGAKANVPEKPKEKKEEAAEKDDTVAEMAKDPRFKDIIEKKDMIDAIISRLPAIAEMETKEAYTLGYLILKGLEGGKEDTAEELVDKLMSRPDCIKLYEQKRQKKLKEENALTPPHAATKGTASMPANVKSAPKTLSEARKEAFGYFGL